MVAEAIELIGSGRSFNHDCHRKKLIQANQLSIVAASSMVFCGYIEQVRRGETSQSAMATIAQFPADFTAGEELEFGSRFGKV